MIKNKEAKKALKTLHKFCMERDCSECILNETRIAINGTKHEMCAMGRVIPAAYDGILDMIKEVKNNVSNNN